METVKVDSKGGVVVVQITVEGTVAWSYKYACDKGTYSNNSAKRAVSVHTLGLPHELSNDIDSWDIVVGNIDDAKQAYVVNVEWIQDNEKLHGWKKAGTLEANKSQKLTDDAWLVSA